MRVLYRILLAIGCVLALSQPVAAQFVQTDIVRIGGSAIDVGAGGVGTATARVIEADDSNLTTNTATIASLALAEDAVAANADKGIATLCVRENTTPTASGAAGDYIWIKCDGNGRIYANVTLYNSSGSEIVNANVTEDAAETAGVSGPMILGVRRDTAASSAGTTGDNATFNTDANGLLWARDIDPCTATRPTVVPISVAADTAVISASASNRNWLCGGVLVASAAEVVSIWEGTGTACGTSSAAIAGSTTEANGLSLAANGGFEISRTIPGLSTNVDTCIRLSATNRVAGYLLVVQAP
jgi:hypothetical protein